MKISGRILFVCILAVQVIICLGQQNQAIGEKMTKKQIDNLSILAKIWGFLKYNDPHYSYVKYNWDSVLLLKIPVFKESNSIEVNKSLNFWLTELGDTNRLLKCILKISKNERTFEDNRWFYKSSLNKTNIEKLEFIRCYSRRDSTYFATYGNSGQVRIAHEKPYISEAYPSSFYRILALFRYWNIVNYFSPYSFLSLKKWDTVLREFLPLVYEAKDSLEYNLGVIRLISQLNDGHSALIWTETLSNHFGIYANMPFLCTILSGRAFVSEIFNDSLCKIDHIQKGDEIVSVDGENITKRIDRFKPYLYSGSNVNSRLVMFSETYLFRGKDSICKIKYFDGNKTHDISIRRYSTARPIFENRTTGKNDTAWSVMKNNIGYVNMGLLQEVDVDVAMDCLINTKAIIFDLRFYPNNTWRRIVDRLARKAFKLGKISSPNIRFPGRFRITDVIVNVKKRNDIYRGKVFLIVNQLTKSHGEFSAIGIQSAVKSVTVGNSTAGSDGDITEWIVLPGGLATRFSGLGIYYNDGTLTQGRGVKINYYIRQSVDDLKSGRDVLLDKTIKLINSKLGVM